MKIRIKTREEMGLRPGARPRHWNPNGQMDHLHGKIYVVVEDASEPDMRYEIVDDNGDTWFICDEQAEIVDDEEKVETKKKEHMETIHILALSQMKDKLIKEHKENTLRFEAQLELIERMIDEENKRSDEENKW